MPDPPLQGSNGRTNGRCLTLQVRDGIHWALSGSVHDPKYEEGHSQQHSQQHSQKHSQRQVSGDFFGDDFTANLTGDLTGNLTGAAQRPLVAISEIRPPYPHHEATAAVMYHAGIPGRRPGFSVTAAGSGSMNRSSRSARHRSSGLPERHRACRASERARAWWGDALAYRRVAGTRRASATRPRRDPQRVAVHRAD